MRVQIGWYVIADSSEVTLNTPLRVRRFGKDWVLWRDAYGKPVAMPDRCPHRSARLSLGTVCDGQIQCPYHGIRFDGSGKCTFVPELGRAAPGMRILPLTTAESHGFIWIWIGTDNAPQGEPPWFEERHAKFVYTRLEATWPVPHTFWIENELDVSHLPFVHKSTIGRQRDPLIRTRFDLTATGIKMFFDPKGVENEDSSFIDFRFPGIWQLGISKSMYQIIAFVPIEESQTKVYLRTYRSFATQRWLRPLIGPALNWFNKKVLEQDRRVVTTQQPKEVSGTVDEILLGQDAAIRYYRSKFAAFIELGNV